MAFKAFIVLALIAATNAGGIAYTAPPIAYSTPLAYAASPFTYAGSAIGSTQENVVRSFGGTVLQYSKAVDTPFSSVRKTDTRINNNVYTPAFATNTVAYAAPAPALYANAAPVVAAKAIAYSPAATVAHVTFDGYGVTMSIK